jgi:hypothetical protein
MTNTQYLLLIAVIVACAVYLGHRLDAVAWEIRRFRVRLLGRSDASNADTRFAQEIRRLYRPRQSSGDASTKS